jgi:hypothetical protein
LVQAQQAETPYYVYVAQWAVPRAQWDAYVAGWEKDTKPVLERMTANGTLVSWGVFTTIVHEADGITHGVWWAGSSIAALERVREELIKMPPAPALTAATRHRDYLLRNLLHRSKTTAPSSGYLHVASWVVKPGRGAEWRELWEKYNKAALEDQFAKGNLLFYSVDVEHVHTQDPGVREVVTISPNAEAEDQVSAAIAAVAEKRSAEERRAIADAFAEVLVPGSHRDYFARVLSWWHK